MFSWEKARETDQWMMGLGHSYTEKMGRKTGEEASKS
jgi:hypothetical protein